MSLSILQKPDQLGSPPARLVIGCAAGVALGTPPDGRGEAVKALRRFQLQILGADYWYTGTVASTGQNLPAPFNVGDS